MRRIGAFMGILSILFGCTKQDSALKKTNLIAIPASVDGYVKVSSKSLESSKVGESHVLYLKVEIGDYAVGSHGSGLAFFHRVIFSGSPFKRKDLESKENFDSGRLVYATLMVKDVYPRKTNDPEIEIDPESKFGNHHKAFAHWEWIDRPDVESLDQEHFLFVRMVKE